MGRTGRERTLVTREVPGETGNKETRGGKPASFIIKSLPARNPRQSRRAPRSTQNGTGMRKKNPRPGRKTKQVSVGMRRPHAGWVEKKSSHVLEKLIGEKNTTETLAVLRGEQEKEKMPSPTRGVVV